MSSLAYTSKLSYTLHIKAKVIQALIQIERPMNWNREKLLDTIKDLINVERYNAVVSRTIHKFNLKWNIFDNLN